MGVTEAVWEEGVNNFVYPYIFTSDSNWSVNVCAYAPTGYAVAGVYDEFGILISSKNCVKDFVSGETKVVAFEIIDVGSPKKFSVVVDIDANHDKVTKKVKLSTDTERVTKDKLALRGKVQSSGTTYAKEGLAMEVSSLFALLSSTSSIVVATIIGSITYFTFGYFLSYYRRQI